MSRASAILGSFVFFWIAPGTVAGWVPYLLTRWEVRPPPLRLQILPILGALLAAAGLLVLLECFARFALRGRGTPAPVAPPSVLVVSGLYRSVRNPMYVGVVGTILGQALLLGSTVLVAYGVAVWLLFHVFVLGYEEPALRRQFGNGYESYCANVRRWWPRLSAWNPSEPTGSASR